MLVASEQKVVQKRQLTDAETTRTQQEHLFETALSSIVDFANGSNKDGRFTSMNQALLNHDSEQDVVCHFALRLIPPFMQANHASVRNTSGATHLSTCPTLSR